MPLVEISGLTKRFGTLTAVDGLDLTLEPGEIFGLLGPNGSGKTTTVKMLLGLLDPDEGSVRVAGMDPAADSRSVKAQIGYVSEEAILYGSLTARDVFELVASVRELDQAQTQERLDRYLAGFDAESLINKSVATMSRGQKQKIEIIAALLHRPQLLILDEPLSGLDAKSVRVLKEIISLHTDRGGAVLFSTHILEVAEELCDRICVIAAGKRVALGTPAELRESASGGSTRLEDIFLKLTREDEEIDQIVSQLREDSQ